MALNLSGPKRVLLRVVRSAVGGVWKPAWQKLALLVREAERKFKESGAVDENVGKLKKEWVIAKFKEYLNPYLEQYPDLAELLFWEAVEEILERYLGRLNALAREDWVEQVENLESEAAYPLEDLLELDLDGDGFVGRRPAVITAILVLFVLAQAGELEARPKLIPHYGDPDEISVEPSVAPSPSPGVRPPLVEHYRPKYQPARDAELGDPEPRNPRRVAVESWAGHQPARGGIDAGVGLGYLVGDFSVAGQLAQDRAGLGLAYKRLGLNYLWNPRDGSWEPGVYLVPMRF